MEAQKELRERLDHLSGVLKLKLEQERPRKLSSMEIQTDQAINLIKETLSDRTIELIEETFSDQEGNSADDVSENDEEVVDGRLCSTLREEELCQRISRLRSAKEGGEEIAEGGEVEGEAAGEAAGEAEGDAEGEAAGDSEGEAEGEEGQEGKSEEGGGEPGRGVAEEELREGAGGGGVARGRGAEGGTREGAGGRGGGVAGGRGGANWRGGMRFSSGAFL